MIADGAYTACVSGGRDDLLATVKYAALLRPITAVGNNALDNRPTAWNISNTDLTTDITIPF